MVRIREVVLLFISSQIAFAFVKLTPQTAAAFDSYVQAAEAQMSRDLDPASFLHAASKPEIKAKLRDGQTIIESGATLPGRENPDIPGGLLQDWLGMMFIPGATIDQVRSVLQDYANYKNFYQPEVIESKEISRHGDQYDIFLRLYEKHILTVVLNAEYHVQYTRLDPKRMSVTSHSTRIAQVKDPKRSYTGEEPIGDDTGFLWRLNSYWRFEEADGGVYAECEAISLSRDVPMGLGFLLKGFLERFPKESMQNTMRGTRDAVLAKRYSGRDVERPDRVRRNVTICQRCASGIWANDGIPLRNDPFSMTQKSAPAGAPAISPRLSAGAFPIP